MPDSTLPGESRLSVGVLRPVPRCPPAIGPHGAQIYGKQTGPEPPQDTAWVGGHHSLVAAGIQKSRSSGTGVGQQRQRWSVLAFRGSGDHALF